MRIAQIAPLFESVPPRLYGGTERVVSYLTEELVQEGHRVTLFASGDSVTSAELVSCSPTALRLDPTVRDPNPHYMVMLEKVRERASAFDILHFHIDYFHFPIFRPIAARTLTTLHGRLDIPDLRPLHRTIDNMPLVSISNAQRVPLATANFVTTIYHGVPLNLYRTTLNPRGRYLAFLGRICPEKRPDLAIKIARTCGIPLKIAAKIDKVDERYFHDVIAPLLDGTGVEYVGEVDERTKGAFLGDAAALLFPIEWPEPFGLAMIEAMACGTPVLAFRRGSVPEIVEPGTTGFVVDTVDEAVKAVPHVMALNRRDVRRRFEERFSARRMARDYIGVYQSLLTKATLRDLDGRRTVVPVTSGRVSIPKVQEHSLRAFAPDEAATSANAEGG
jgi:glycosyltransferase involved in cell wall biosynthesis